MRNNGLQAIAPPSHLSDDSLNTAITKSSGIQIKYTTNKVFAELSPMLPRHFTKVRIPSVFTRQEYFIAFYGLIAAICLKFYDTSDFHGLLCKGNITNS